MSTKVLYYPRFPESILTHESSPIEAHVITLPRQHIEQIEISNSFTVPVPSSTPQNLELMFYNEWIGRDYEIWLRKLYCNEFDLNMYDDYKTTQRFFVKGDIYEFRMYGTFPVSVKWQPEFTIEENKSYFLVELSYDYFEAVKREFVEKPKHIGIWKDGNIVTFYKQVDFFTEEEFNI